MSRVGKTPISIPSDVKVEIQNRTISVAGKLGKLSLSYPECVDVEINNSILTVKPQDDSKNARMNWGTIQRRISNMVSDVSKGVTTNLEMVGVGYRASVQGNTVTMQLGFSHEITYKLPAGITVACPKPTNMDVTGFDRELVGQVVAELCKYRPSEPYKGKGVNKVGQFILRKEGKKK